MNLLQESCILSFLMAISVMKNIIKTDFQFAMKKGGGRMVNFIVLNITQMENSVIGLRGKKKNGIRMGELNPKWRIIIGERMAIFCWEKAGILMEFWKIKPGNGQIEEGITWKKSYGMRMDS